MDEIRHLLKQIVSAVFHISRNSIIFLQNFRNNLLILRDIFIDLQLRDLLLDIPSKVILNLRLDVFVQYAFLELFFPEEFEQ